MPIVFSAITPHPPVIIPQIGKENLERLKPTIAAFAKLKTELEEKKPDTIIIISPHGQLFEDVFAINQCPEYTANFENFGDFATKGKWSGDIGLVHRIREKFETTLPLQLISDSSLDHGTSVPLFMMTEKLPDVKIIPMFYSGLSRQEHFSFGESLGEFLQEKKQRIAIIASGDLSHRLSKEAPGGFSPKGKKFDKKLIDGIIKGKKEDIIGLDDAFIEEAGQCGLNSILILLGAIDTIKKTARLLSYEAPFGVGYAVINFEI
jgi:MEMO1 family protein